MIVEMHAADFVSAVKRAGTVIEARHTAEIWGCLLLSVDGNVLTVTGSNMAQQVAVSLPCAVEGESDITALAVDAALLKAAVKSGGTVRLEFTPDFLNLSASRRQISLRALRGEDYPRFSDRGDAVSFAWDAEQARQFLVPRPAMSDEETRYYLNGVHLHGTATGLRAVATNGHIMVVSDITMDAPVEIPPIIVPREAVAALAVAADGRDITVHVSQNAIAFEAAGVRVDSKLIDGRFPDYARVMAGAEGSRAYFASMAGFADAVRAVAIFREKERIVAISPADTGYKISMMADGHAAEDIFACQAGTVKFGANAKYIDAVASVIPGPATLYNSDEASPMLFLPGEHYKGDELPNVQFVLMPCRT